jgi:hypothetical protein
MRDPHPGSLALSDWLVSEGCEQVALESTGVYWKSVFNMLEEVLEVVLVNARHVKAAPGRKTDVRDLSKRSLPSKVNFLSGGRSGSLATACRVNSKESKYPRFLKN